MGRHSAPSDDDDRGDTDDGVTASSGVLTDDDAAQGRHSHRLDDTPTQQFARPRPGGAAPTVEPPLGDAPTGPVWTTPIGIEDHPESLVGDELLPGGFLPEPELPASDRAATKPAKKPKRPRPGSGDLALVRRHSDVRARVIAAVVVPFVVYFAVLIAIGATGRQMLLFIFIPLILAGVLVGTFLDLGHKKYAPSAGSGASAGSVAAPVTNEGEPPPQAAWQELPAHWNQTIAWPRQDPSSHDESPSETARPE